VEQGALYPALYRLEERGMLASEWGVSDNNRRAKYYRLTRKGEKRLREQTDTWNRLAAAMATVLDARPEEV
jgi:DNA-binding PadR family transcriptional regulator